MTDDPSQADAIERDLDAIEDALVALGRAAQNDAKHRGLTALDQAANEDFRSTHSQLAALIKDPVNELCYLGMETLRLHLETIAEPEEVGALFQRVTERVRAEVGSQPPSPERLQ
jgi:hypothetical protein